MNKIEWNVEPKHVLGFTLMILGIIVISHALILSLVGIDVILEEVESAIVATQALLKVLAWFFRLLIECLAGFFLALIGIKIMKKD